MLMLGRADATGECLTFKIPNILVTQRSMSKKIDLHLLTLARWYLNCFSEEFLHAQFKYCAWQV